MVTEMDCIEQKVSHSSSWKTSYSYPSGLAVSAPKELEFFQFPSTPMSFGCLAEANQYTEIFLQDVSEKWSDSVEFLYNHRCTVCRLL